MRATLFGLALASLVSLSGCALDATPAGDPQLGADAELAQRLPPLQRARDGWRAVAAAIDTVAQQVAAGELTRADAGLRAAPTTVAARELTALVDVVARCRSAFERVDQQLDLVAAAEELTAARTLAAELPPAVAERIAAWQLGLSTLQERTTGMVAIAAGRTKKPAAQVPAFFVDASECSRAEFAAFVRELRELVADASTREARFAVVAERLAAADLTPDRLQDLLDQEPRDGEQPIERVTWHEAAAFAAFRGKALPSEAEWALLAFGDGGRFEFPWGNGWSNDPECRNPSDRTPAEVGQGGLSWRRENGLRVHHVAGNVAEWLATAAGAREAPLAGGRYNLRSERDQREQAQGRHEVRYKTDTTAGVGFRTVLRPRDFAPLAWPR